MQAELSLDLVSEAKQILSDIDFPFDALPNAWAERTPKVMLALAGLTKDRSWDEVRGWGDENPPLFGSRELLTAVNNNWGENISRGSYDEIRRRCVKFLVEAGVALKNPDDINRAPNSPATKYSLSAEAAKLLRSRGTPNYGAEKDNFIQACGSLKDRLRAEREMSSVPVILPGGLELRLSPGAHNILQKEIVEEFLPRFAPGSELIYLGDALNRTIHKDQNLIKELGLFDLEHEQLPDVISYLRDKNWLFLTEAVTSTGPISQLRKLELERQLKKCNADVVFVTAFPNRETFKRFVPELAWETEVWIAEDPTHLIHFNGEKFLGPYAG